MIQRYSVWVALLGLAGCLLSVPAVAHARSLDSQPSAYADGQRDRVNTQAPTTSAQLAGWAPFVFARGYRRHVPTVPGRRPPLRPKSFRPITGPLTGVRTRARAVTWPLSPPMCT